MKNPYKKYPDFSRRAAYVEKRLRGFGIGEIKNIVTVAFDTCLHDSSDSEAIVYHLMDKVEKSVEAGDDKGYGLAQGIKKLGCYEGWSKVYRSATRPITGL